MTKDLKELQVNGLTSKGSKFRKSVFEYLSIDSKNKNNKLIVEVNSFANPFPFQQLPIKSFIYDFLKQTGNEKFIVQYDLQYFEINVLNKEQTLLEKLVSLIRFSFDKNIIESLASKIRHFYDLYFLIINEECASFINSDKFKEQFNVILKHDKEMFDEPTGWKDKSAAESPLIMDFDNVWKQLKSIYKTELTALAYTAIPDENKIAEHFNELKKRIQ